MNENEDKIRHPQQNRSIKTKDSILKAAMELFSSKGYHNTNSKEIAALAGVSTGSFYSYFADKRALFIEVLKLYNLQFNERLYFSLGQLKLEHSDKSAAISHFIDSLIDAHDVFKEFHSELEAMYHSDSEVKALRDEQYQQGRELTKTYMQEWTGELRVIDLEAASILVFEMINRLVDVIVFDKNVMNVNRLKEELVDMIVRYLFQLKIGEKKAAQRTIRYRL